MFEKFCTFPRKASPWNCVFKQSYRLPDTYWNVLLGNLWNFQNIFHKKHAQIVNYFWITFESEVKSMFRNYSSFIQNMSAFTKDFKNHKTNFKPLISGKTIYWTIQKNFKTFRNVCFGFCLVCCFTSLHDFFIWENVYVMSSIVLITHTVIFQNKF